MSQRVTVEKWACHNRVPSVSQRVTVKKQSKRRHGVACYAYSAYIAGAGVGPRCARGGYSAYPAGAGVGPSCARGGYSAHPAGVSCTESGRADDMPAKQTPLAPAEQTPPAKQKRSGMCDPSSNAARLRVSLLALPSSLPSFLPFFPPSFLPATALPFWGVVLCGRATLAPAT